MVNEDIPNIEAASKSWINPDGTEEEKNMFTGLVNEIMRVLELPEKYKDNVELIMKKSQEYQREFVDDLKLNLKYGCESNSKFELKYPNLHIAKDAWINPDGTEEERKICASLVEEIMDLLELPERSKIRVERRLRSGEEEQRNFTYMLHRNVTYDNLNESQLEMKYPYLETARSWKNNAECSEEEEKMFNGLVEDVMIALKLPGTDKVKVETSLKISKDYLEEFSNSLYSALNHESDLKEYRLKMNYPNLGYYSTSMNISDLESEAKKECLEKVVDELIEAFEISDIQRDEVFLVFDDEENCCKLAHWMKLLEESEGPEDISKNRKRYFSTPYTSHAKDIWINPRGSEENERMFEKLVNEVMSSFELPEEDRDGVKLSLGSAEEQQQEFARMVCNYVYREYRDFERYKDECIRKLKRPHLVVATGKWINADGTDEEKKLFQGLLEDIASALELVDDFELDDGDREALNALLRVGKRKQKQLVEAVYDYLHVLDDQNSEEAINMIDGVKTTLALIRMMQN